jgi:hypothetical protein
MKTGEQVNIFVGSEDISRLAICKFFGSLISEDEIKRKIILGKPGMANCTYSMKDSKVLTNTEVKSRQCFFQQCSILVA